MGFDWSGFFDDPPVICHESCEAPSDPMERFVSSTWPGVRVPSLFLGDGSAILHELGNGLTLLRFADADVNATLRAGAQRTAPLDVVEMRDDKPGRVYELNLVLVRPAQRVDWRGNEPPAVPPCVIDRVRGALR